MPQKTRTPLRRFKQRERLIEASNSRECAEYRLLLKRQGRSKKAIASLVRTLKYEQDERTADRIERWWAKHPEYTQHRRRKASGESGELAPAGNLTSDKDEPWNFFPLEAVPRVRVP